MASVVSLLIDGSVLEGGGQLLRNSIAYSALLSKPISIHNIRYSRKPPGLKHQHASGIRLAGDICSADLTGVENGSCAIDFQPGPIRLPGTFSADPGTAGSTTLLLQISLPCLLFSPATSLPSTLAMGGGTNATLAPQIDFTHHIFLPFLRRHFGLDLTLDISKRGYFPRGGGKVICSIYPITGPLRAVTLTNRGDVLSVKGIAHVGGLPAHMARSMAEGARTQLVAGGLDNGNMEIATVREANEKVMGAGGGVVLWATTEGGCLIGGSAVSQKGLQPSEVGKRAAIELLRNLDHGGCVDEYLQDQMIIFLALSQGRSTVKTGPLTLHTRTAIWVAEQMTGAIFHTEEHPDGQATIMCDGIGFRATDTFVPASERSNVSD